MVKSTIGKRVNYGKEHLRGTVKDEVILQEAYEGFNKDYLDLIQYIRWDNGRYGIRICYYVREHGSSDKDWIFANRPLSISQQNLQTLLNRARKKDWFPEIE